MLFLRTLSFVLSCAYWIANGNLTVSNSDVLGASLAICGTIIYILNCSPSSALTKKFFSVIIEALIVCRNGHENIVFRYTPSTRLKETIAGCPFSTNGVL